MSIEVKDEKMTNRSRKIKFFLDKMKAQENQTDSVAKLVKDLIVRKAITWVKAAAPIVGLVLLLLVLVVAMIAVPVIAAIAILYNSPFALFLPPLESGDTVQTVTSAYVQEFNRDVNTKVNEHTGYDLESLYMWTMKVWKKTQAITMTSWLSIWSSMVSEILQQS